jgi:alkylated DNA repair protein alkB homolog 1
MQTTSEDLDLFTPVFKHFRRLPDADCLKEAFSITSHPHLFQRSHSSITLQCDPSLGLQPVANWSLYACQFADGLYLLPNPFTLRGQRQWIDRCVNSYARQLKTSVGDNANNQHLSRLRWATLGYHYDWTNKIYQRDDHTPMPQELAQLCQILMQYISGSSSKTRTKRENFSRTRSSLQIVE